MMNEAREQACKWKRDKQIIHVPQLRLIVDRLATICCAGRKSRWGYCREYSETRPCFPDVTDYQDSPNACVTMGLPIGIFEEVCLIEDFLKVGEFKA